MYVCVYVCMYVCMYVCVYVCMYVCMYVCLYVCFVVAQELWIVYLPLPRLRCPVARAHLLLRQIFPLPLTSLFFPARIVHPAQLPRLFLRRAKPSTHYFSAHATPPIAALQLLLYSAFATICLYLNKASETNAAPSPLVCMYTK